MKAKSDAADDAMMVPVGTISRALDLTPRRIQQLVNEEVLPKADRGRYPLVDVVRAYVAHLRAEPEIAQGNLDPVQERARKDRALAISAEIKNDLATGKVVLIDVVIAHTTERLLKVRNKLLSIPTRVASRAAVLTKAEPVRALIHDEIVVVLQELSDAVPSERVA